MCRNEKELRENSEAAGPTAFADDANARAPIRMLPMPNPVFPKKVRRVTLFMSLIEVLIYRLFKCYFEMMGSA